MRYDTVFRQRRGHRLKKFCKTWAEVAFVKASQKHDITPEISSAPTAAAAAAAERRRRGGDNRKNSKRDTLYSDERTDNPKISNERGDFRRYASRDATAATSSRLCLRTIPPKYTSEINVHERKRNARDATERVTETVRLI